MLILHDWSKLLWEYGLKIKSVVFLMLLSLLSTITEMFGVGIFFPIYQFIQSNGNVDSLLATSDLWRYLIEAFDYINLDISLLGLLFIAFFLFLLRQILIYTRLVYHAVLMQQSIQYMRSNVFSKYLSASSDLYDDIPVGNLVNIVLTEIRQAVSGVMAPMELMVYLVMVVVYFVLLLFISWEMTIASIVILSLVSIFSRKWFDQSRKYGRKLVCANEDMTTFLISRFRSPVLVRLSGTEIAEKNQFSALTYLQRKHSVVLATLKAKTDVAIEPLVVGLSLIFLYLSYSVLSISIEMIGLYLLVVMRLMPIVRSILVKWQTIQRLQGSIEALQDRLSYLVRSIEDDSGSIPFVGFKVVRFDSVFFKYKNSDLFALQDVSFSVCSGTFTALVGPSGSGKSTLIDLLPRIREPDQGVITIDNCGLNEFSLSALRSAISYAPQEPQVFDGTVREHIQYGKTDASDNDIIWASKLAGAHSFISALDSGYDTLLCDDAMNLSGGQRQRLDLARAIVRKSPILILDEPTSNLDAESEAEFIQALRRIRNKTSITVIVVAHRLSTVADADQIIVLNKGTVEMIGLHDDLMSCDGWYKNAWNIQNRKFSIEI